MAEYAGLKRKHVQNFLNTQLNKTRRGIIDDSYDEPTYLGFWVKFEFNEGIVDQGGLMDADSLPAGLLADVEANYSAERYLRNIGYPDRADTLKAFKELLRSISEEAPWYITSVEGLAEIYKIDPLQNFRGKDKKISLEFLEGIDMRVSSMFDAYRKASFDSVYMRNLLPDIMRYFTMQICITEFRTFHTPTRTNSGNKEQITPPTPGGNQFGLNTSSGPIAALAGQLRNTFSEEGINSQIERLNTWLNGTGSDAGSGIYFLRYMDENLSVVKFVLSDCEFDLTSLAPSWTTGLKTESAEAATYKADIKVGKIREVAGYPILFDAIKELASNNFNDEELSRVSFDGQRTGIAKLDIKAEYNRAQGEAGLGGSDSVYEQGPYRNGHLKPLSDIVRKSLGERLLDGLEESAFARGRNFLQEQIDGRLLGNVYGASPSTILRSISENPNALAEALRNTLTRATNSTVADLILGNIYDNLPEPSSAIKKGASSVGLTSGNNTASSVVDSNFENTATSGANLGNAGLNNNGATLSGNPGNVGLIGSPSNPANLTNAGLSDNGSTLTGNPGNAGLSDNGSTLAGNVGNAGLSDNGSTLEGNPGNAGLSDNGSTLEGNSGNAGLEDNGSTLAGNPGNAGLENNGSTLKGNSGNVGLEDNGSTLEGKPGNVELEDNGSTLEGSLENARLSDNGSTLEGNPGNAGLSDNGSTLAGNAGNAGLSDNGSTLEGILENAGLSDNGSSLEGNVGNVGLEDNGSSLAGNLGNVNLKGSSKSQESLNNVGLTGSNPPEATLGNVELSSQESKTTTLGNINLRASENPEVNLRNVGLEENKETTKSDLGNIGLTSFETSKTNLGNVNLKESSKVIDEKLGNVGFDKSSPTEQTLGNIGLKASELRKTNPGNINLKETTPANSELGNIGYREKVQIVRQLGNINFNDDDKVKSFLGNANLSSNGKTQDIEKRNIGLEGDENNLTPPTGTNIQNSSSDLPPIEP